jgi:hypothetical protein
MRKLLQGPLHCFEHLYERIVKHEEKYGSDEWKEDILTYSIEAVEFEPQFRTIKMMTYPGNPTRVDVATAGTTYRAVRKIYNLPFPYMQFTLLQNPPEGLSQLFVSMSKAPIEDLEATGNIYSVPLPNIGGGDYVCLDGISPPTLMKAVELFWVMPFDDTPWHDWEGSTRAKMMFGSYETWSKLRLEEVFATAFVGKCSLSEFVYTCWISQ